MRLLFLAGYEKSGVMPTGSHPAAKPHKYWLFQNFFYPSLTALVQRTLRQRHRQENQIHVPDEYRHLHRSLYSSSDAGEDSICPEELTAEMLNELVDKIIVHAPDKSSGHRKQKIEIYYKAAGIIDIADDLCEAGDGRGWQRSMA